MAAGQSRPRSGCCCELFVGFDAETERQVTNRAAAHHCCPTHGGAGDAQRQTAAR